MRKRNIKTVAHWVIMCFLLLFPIVLVGISAFANDEQSVTVTETYEYETNEVNHGSDLILGNVYKLNGDYEYVSGFNYNLTFSILNKPMNNGYFTIVDLDLTDAFIDDTSLFGYTFYSLFSSGIGSCYVSDTFEFDFNFSEVHFNNLYIVLTAFDDNNDSLEQSGLLNVFYESDYLGYVTTDVEITESNYKQEVNNWANGFKRLPVNQWYGQLLDVIGVGQTTNSVMNVIYVYPLYVLWVYLIDLILDCLLVIVNLGHNVLKRVDGDIE